MCLASVCTMFEMAKRAFGLICLLLISQSDFRVCSSFATPFSSQRVSNHMYYF